MAASTKRKVHVEYQSSDSEYDADSDVSLNDLDDEDLPDDDDVPSPQGKTGLADVMSKILNKQVPAHKQVILAKAKTDKELRKRKQTEVEETEDKDEKPGKKVKVKVEKGKEDAYTDLVLAKQEKLRLWENMCRSKPEPLDRPRERVLQRIATRGVVQLFNAVRQQQKQLEGEITQVGSSVRRKDKVLAGMTKDKFLNILKGTSATNVKVEKEEPVVKVKPEAGVESEEKRWNILRDDFMMGARMKDWNKESSDEEGDEEEPGDPGLSDSD